MQWHGGRRSTHTVHTRMVSNPMHSLGKSGKSQNLDRVSLGGDKNRISSFSRYRNEDSAERGTSPEPISQYRQENNSSTENLQRESRVRLVTENQDSLASRSRETLKLFSHHSKDVVNRSLVSNRRGTREDWEPVSQQLTPLSNMYRPKGPPHVYMHQAVTINPASENAKKAQKQKQRIMRKFAVR